MIDLSELNPDLRAYFHSDGWLHHPLVIGLPGCIDPARINERYLYKKQLCIEAERNEDWSEFIFLHQRPYRTKALVKALRRCHDPVEAALLVTEVWIDSENLRQHRADWLKIWTALPDSRLTMNEDERAALRALPDRIRVFRGFQKFRKRGLRGLSWTTDRAKAEYFAQRFSVLGQRGFVASGTVRKSNVLAYFSGRMESEVVVLPDNVRGVTVCEG